MEIAKNQIDTAAKRRLSVSLYLNYLVHGMGLIILAQNMNSLGMAWNQPIKIVSFDFGDRDWTLDLIPDYRLFIGQDQPQVFR